MSNLIDSLEHYYARRDNEGNLNEQEEPQPDLDEYLDEDDEFDKSFMNYPSEEELEED